MKCKTRKVSGNFFLILTAILLVSISSVLAAQTSKDSLKRIEKAKANKCIVNLNTAIQSDNLGLRRSAIYLAGEYGFKECIGSLLNQFKKEQDPNTRILIALVFYKLGDARGLEAVLYSSKKDPDLRVRKMCKEILDIEDIAEITKK